MPYTMTLVTTATASADQMVKKTCFLYKLSPENSDVLPVLTEIKLFNFFSENDKPIVS